ncbi:MAG: FtsW/RodA/SpoVE family cell cycle protein [Bacteroidales bacterium]|nr:FtsW/RodA/SpoVE family cell cycle protein [Bacteroidales bacterium]
MAVAIRKYLGGDRIIWAVVVLLSLYSLLAVYSTSGILVFRTPGSSSTYFVMRHGLFLVAGFIIIYLTHLVPYKYFSRLAQLMLVAAIPLLIITLFFGKNINEASRWLEIPILGMSFQTSDFAKLALIMFVARVLSQEQENIKDFYRAFLPVIVPIGIICLLILPEDLSTALILFLTCVVMMFIGRIHSKYLGLLFLIGVLTIGLYITIVIITEKEGRVGTWQNRIESYFNKDVENYQVQQAKIAIASGGILGKFPGNSTQRNFLPHPYSDFIYAVIIEEYGLLLGGIPILLFYLILLYRAGVIVRKSSRTFPAFLALGLTLGLVIQAFVHMAVAVNLLPVTGQPLPLISMGGTSMIFTSISIGMILSVSRGVNEQLLMNESEDQDEQEEQ